jgi:hypothetical protein
MHIGKKPPLPSDSQSDTLADDFHTEMRGVCAKRTIAIKTTNDIVDLLGWGAWEVPCRRFTAMFMS